MPDDIVGLIVGLVTLTFGGAGAYGGLAVIRNLHGLRDRLLKQFADRPGGWQRSDHHSEPVQSGFGLSFEYVPKTAAQAAVIGWLFLLAGLVVAAFGLLIVVAALLGQIEQA